MRTKTIYRSSITGKIVTKKYALANPDTTVKETVDGKRYVYIVQNKNTLIIHGVFETEDKAVKFSNNSENIAIVKNEVI